jgi:WD40-like Beta Propeller Repeat
MNIRFFCAGIFYLISTSYVFSQAERRRLPSSVNHPAINHFAPYMSFDGDAIVFLSDNAEDYELIPFYSYRDPRTDWKEPEPLPKTLYSRLNFLWGYTLGPEGRFLYFSTIKSPGLGGYDLWISERKGSGWTQPVNLAVPVNSRSNEACATLTPDQKKLYFMRCDKMDQRNASGCAIMVADKKSNGQWGEPTELPGMINTGNSQAPRILADGETLIFSSDKFRGNRGAMDLYLSRLKDGEWTKPVPLDFVNSADNDQFVSVNAVGRYLLRDAPGKRKREMVEYLIPPNLRPKGLMRVDGKISGSTADVAAAYISITDLVKKKRIYSGRPNRDGSFKLFLLEGSEYEVSVDPEQSNFNFYSRKFDLTGDSIEQVVKLSTELKPVMRGDEIELDQVEFKENSAELVPEAENELKRVIRLMNGNPDLEFEIQVMMAGYVEDSIQSLPDMTEVLYDSSWTKLDDIDSLGQLYQRDTLVVNIRYNNDRTVEQAQNVVAYLIEQGVKESSLSYFANARPLLDDEEKNILVKVRVKP